VEISRKELLGAIKKVLPAVSKKEIFDQAHLVAFVAGKAVAFNDAVAIMHPLPGDLDLDGAVDGTRLCELLGRLSADTVNLVVEEGKIGIRAGRSRTSFDLLPTRLPIDSIDLTGEMVDLSATFADQLRWASTSCAKDASRPALTCVLVADGWMQSSDSYRLSRVQCGDDLPRLMLPLSQVDVLVDYPIKRVALSAGGEWARFETDDGTTLCARSMSGAYPNLDHIYQVEGSEVQLTDALGEVLERARIFARRERQIDEEVTVAMRPNQVTISARCDGAEFSEVVRCEGVEGGVQFVIHPRFLASALESGTRCVVGDRSVKFSGKGRDGEGNDMGSWDHVVALKAG
jgi:DNA polymerase III sliding clamp (beta) subunit (PCNA family)